MGDKIYQKLMPWMELCKKKNVSEYWLVLIFFVSLAYLLKVVMKEAKLPKTSKIFIILFFIAVLIDQILIWISLSM